MLGGKRCGRQAALAVVGCALALLVSAAPASAANRFAEVGGNGPEPCLASDPCSIETAINSASTATSDDVTLLGGLPPAPYTTSTALVVPSNVTVHGTIGARPVIETDVNNDTGVEIHAGSVLRDVIVNYSGTNEDAITLIGGGTLERVSGVATATSGSAEGGCGTDGAGTYLIRDSVCWHGEPGGANGGGIDAANFGAGAQTLVLRNVTAVSVNARAGLFARNTNGGVTVNATNVIAQSATGADVDVFNDGTVNLDHSNYDSEGTDGVITNPGTGTPAANQTTPPVFVNAGSGDFHQTAASTGTINLGVSGVVNGIGLGSLDFDGQMRTIGAAPDIGADELGRPSTTAVACTPPSLTLGAGSSTCTATVTDAGTGPTTPTGSVGFTTDGAGTCTLSPVSTGVASCPLSYTPSAVGTGTHLITGSYLGGSSHDPSQGSAQVGVSAPAPPPAGGGAAVQPPPARCGGKTVTIARGRATISGTAGNDTIVGTPAADVIDGAGGNDTIRGLGGKDTICGDEGKDTLKGGAGNDKLLGGPGKDVLKGGKGRDKLKGGPGRDTQIQ
jgi:Ca2+-binding RTX toxin-like protein